MDENSLDQVAAHRGRSGTPCTDVRSWWSDPLAPLWSTTPAQPSAKQSFGLPLCYSFASVWYNVDWRAPDAISHLAPPLVACGHDGTATGDSASAAQPSIPCRALWGALLFPLCGPLMESIENERAHLRHHCSSVLLDEVRYKHHCNEASKKPAVPRAQTPGRNWASPVRQPQKLPITPGTRCTTRPCEPQDAVLDE